MTLTIELTPEQETRLREKARVIGVEPAEYLIRTIEEPLQRFPRSGAEIAAAIMADPEIVDIGDPALDAPEAARTLRKKVWRIGEKVTG